jgi:hypothetical protein
MNFHVIQTAMIFAALTVTLVPMRAQGQDPASDAEPEQVAWNAQFQAETIETLSPLVADLLRLQRANFNSIEAKQAAIRQWHDANGAALKSESDARREADRPKREKLEKQARLRQLEILKEQVADGNLEALEAEFIRLTRTPFTSGKDRRDAIAKWRAEKGAALDAERENRRSREAPHMAALQAESLQARRQHIEDAVQNGQIGAREAELMRLHQRSELPPAEKQKAIRQWMSANGAELQSEKSARRQGLPADPSSPLVPDDSSAF